MAISIRCSQQHHNPGDTHAPFANDYYCPQHSASAASPCIVVAGMMETDTRPITPIPLDPAASQRSLQSLAAAYVLPPQGCSARQRAITTAQHTRSRGARPRRGGKVWEGDRGGSSK